MECILLYGCESWVIKRAEEKYLESFEMWLWRRMEGIKWTDKVRNEEVLRRVGEQRSLLKAIRKRKRNWLGHIMYFAEIVSEESDGRKNRGKERKRKKKARYIE
uniref:Uncharacterized protein n=1 Tax=Cacopsylla melanoneura TaxID=428564 RepID=A0A8D8M013_9HEMI